MSDTSQVANPGSTLGEAVGALVEKEVNRLMRPIAEEYGCVYVTAGKPDPHAARATKLLMQDAAGRQFQIAAVIASRRIQPLILIDAVYAGNAKRAQEKGSEIGVAHHHLRSAYPAIRQSIAVLIGNWSASSKAIMRSSDTTIFEVGTPKIVSTLAQYGIEFEVSEKEPEHAIAAWHRWKELNASEYDAIAHALLEDIEPELRKTLQIALNRRLPRKTRAPRCEKIARL